MSNKYLDNNVFSIIGERGAGKTQLACILASDYQEIFSNFELKIKGKKINKYNGNLKFEDGKPFLGKIELKKSNQKKIIIQDEAGINYNSKKSQTKENMSFSEFVIVSRKYNFDIIFITTQDYSINKDFRYETNFRFNCSKKFDEDGNFYTLVEKLKLNRYTGKIELIDEYKMYGIILLKKLGISYDTTDIARTTETKKDLKF